MLTDPWSDRTQSAAMTAARQPSSGGSRISPARSASASHALIWKLLCDAQTFGCSTRAIRYSGSSVGNDSGSGGRSLLESRAAAAGGQGAGGSNCWATARRARTWSGSSRSTIQLAREATRACDAGSVRSGGNHCRALERAATTSVRRGNRKPQGAAFPQFRSVGGDSDDSVPLLKSSRSSRARARSSGC
jgi:hypothetical protein